MGKRGPEKQFPRFVKVQVTDEMGDWIEGLATTLGLTVPDTVRMLLTSYIASMEESVRQWIDETFEKHEKEMQE